MKLWLKYSLLVAAAWAINLELAHAHEAYVLPRNFFWKELRLPFSSQALDALKNPHNLHITIAVVGGVFFLLVLNFLFRLSAVGEKLNRLPEKLSFLGPFFVRIAIAAAFFFSAKSGAFLGPELRLADLPLAGFLRAGLYAASAMIAAGFLTELAALIGLIAFTIGFFSFGAYLATYLNYLGELVVLFLFGMRRWSLDRLIFGPLRRLREKWEHYETTIVRIFYGVALIYAGVTVKFLHPELTVKVATDWHLAKFWWLFPSDPLLITLGAGMAEVVIGLFIALGFELRMTVLISLFYITLSLIYFRELVWPHFLLYGISLNLLVQPEVFTIDHFLFESHRAAKNWWGRFLSPHQEKGKSSA